MSYTIVNIENPINRILPPYSYPVGCQLQIPEPIQPIEPLNFLYLILYEVDVRQLFKMIHVLDMLDLVEAQIEACETFKGVQAFDV